jgi:hypothetical protein
VSLRWDVVPVIVQDPTWEQSFPDVSGVIVPLAEPSTGEVVNVRLTREEAAARRRANEQRLDTLVSDFTALGLDSVVIGTSDRVEIDRALLRWAELRRQAWRRGR